MQPWGRTDRGRYAQHFPGCPPLGCSGGACDHVSHSDGFGPAAADVLTTARRSGMRGKLKWHHRSSRLSKRVDTTPTPISAALLVGFPPGLRKDYSPSVKPNGGLYRRGQPREPVVSRHDATNDGLKTRSYGCPFFCASAQCAVPLSRGQHSCGVGLQNQCT